MIAQVPGVKKTATISKRQRFLCYDWKHLILWFQVLKTGTFWYLKFIFDFAQNCPFQDKIYKIAYFDFEFRIFRNNQRI